LLRFGSVLATGFLEPCFFSAAVVLMVFNPEKAFLDKTIKTQTSAGLSSGNGAPFSCSFDRPMNFL